jgi:AraC-like DNA-binding protein
MIEFEQDDFDILTKAVATKKTLFTGAQSNVLTTCIFQYIQWETKFPEAILKLRRKEILMLLHLQGYSDVASMRGHLSTTNTLIDMFREDIAKRWAIKDICHKLSTSESTLRRQLRSENTGFNDLQTQVKLGHGIHLIQTTKLPVLNIAEQCGYQSQSRFTESFKKRFGITPLKLRKTHLAE